MTLLSGTITSNAIEFIRSGRFSVISAMFGRGRSTRTKSLFTGCTLSRAAGYACSPSFWAARAASTSRASIC